jgi:hypothetical protein
LLTQIFKSNFYYFFKQKHIKWPLQPTVANEFSPFSQGR